MPADEWKLPLNIAIAFHVLIALAIVYLPQLLAPTPRIEELYTVNLINIADLAPTAAETPAKPEPPAKPAPAKPAPAKPAPAKPIPKVTPQKVAEKAIALEEPEITEPTPVTPVATPEAVSIKPMKQKVKNELPPEPPPKKVEKDMSQLQRQRLAEMIRAEQKAAEEARILAEEAELEKRLAEAALNRMKAAASRPTTSATQAAVGGPRVSDQPSALEKQYYAAIIARIQAFWSLPEYRKWDPELKATVVITVEKDGRIAGSYFESQSSDKTFDRFAAKTLQDVGHLPPIPAAIRKDRLEIGLNFTPGGIR